jgi:hypothetical protein
MKSAVLLATSSLLFAASAFAQTPPTKALPPPGINDPGVHATTTPAKKPLDLKPHAVPSPQANVVAAPGDALPDVDVRKEGDNTIQEYRRNGQLYMVVVTPKTGIPHTYTVDPQGRLVDEHGQKPTRPVMYKVLEWGKSPPATAPEDDAGEGQR